MRSCCSGQGPWAHSIANLELMWNAASLAAHRPVYADCIWTGSSRDVSAHGSLRCTDIKGPDGLSTKESDHMACNRPAAQSALAELPGISKPWVLTTFSQHHHLHCFSIWNFFDKVVCVRYFIFPSGSGIYHSFQKVDLIVSCICILFP